jgi:hypothetical protein
VRTSSSTPARVGLVKPDFRFRVKLRQKMRRTAIEEAAAELRPFDAMAFRSIDYATIRAGRAGEERDGGMSANAAESYRFYSRQEKSMLEKKRRPVVHSAGSYRGLSRGSSRCLLSCAAEVNLSNTHIAGSGNRRELPFNYHSYYRSRRN